MAAVAFATMLSLNLAGCGNSNKTLGGSQDTSSVNRAGGPPITDTATVTQNEKVLKAVLFVLSKSIKSLKLTKIVFFQAFFSGPRSNSKKGFS